MTNLTPEIPDFLDNALKNLSDEPTKAIATIIKDAIYLKFGTISYKAKQLKTLHKYGLKEFENRLAKCINKIPTEKLLVPDFQTVVLAIENMEPSMNSKELRNLFSNLIAHACNHDYANYIHPSFPEILRQMSPLDAKILKFYTNNNIDCLITYRYKTSDGKRFDRVPYILDSYPNPDESDYISMSISSLMRLGILSIQDDAILCPITNSLFESSSFYKKCEQERIEDGKYISSSIYKQMSTITSFGQAFIHACYE